MKLHICFLWHMHQPHYKDPETGTYILPWVRLHAIKDYVALPRIFREVPEVRHTFNLVPSLLIQIQDYVDGGAQDIFLTVSRKNALDLTRDERTFLLRNFFSAFPPTMILPHPRYAELFHGKEDALKSVGKPGSPGEFGASDYTDLATLFNLSWFHPLIREGDPDLDRLWRKGRGYTERDKEYVLSRQIDVMAEVIPEYRKVAGQDGGELTSSPMYHPILPLLIDNRTAQDALPGAPLPKVPFVHPEDAEEQLRRGKEVFRGFFGADPSGLWPSEGSISPATLDLACRQGFRWSATDEILLSRALGKSVHRDAEGVPQDPNWLYRPYTAKTSSGTVQMFFRDHHLSDLIGFEYSRWDTSDAVKNFLHHISKIHSRLSSVPAHSRHSDYVVPIILDGENAWEYFYDSGRLFLRTLMKQLGALSPDVSCITFSEAVERCKNTDVLPSIPFGSWIDGTFNIWIGHAEDHAAWDFLSRARSLWEFRKEQSQKTGRPAPSEIDKALNHLFVAEGSDWCWWYGDDHFTPHGPEFDRLFRHHLKAAYKHMGDDFPDSLGIPIIQPGRIPATRNHLPCPRTYISPKINGKITSYFEWSSATRYVPTPEFGSMHRADYGVLLCLYYGFSETRVFFRLDFKDSLFESSIPYRVEFLFPAKDKKLCVLINPPSEKIVSGLGPIGINFDDPEAKSGFQHVTAAFHKVLEFEIPFDDLEFQQDRTFEFILTINAQGAIGERWPMYGTFKADLPGSDFEDRMWEV